MRHCLELHENEQFVKLTRNKMCRTENLEPHYDDLEIHLLEESENCEYLRRFDLNSMLQKVDLQSLTRFSKLEMLVVNLYSACNYEALLSIPSLKTLEIDNRSSFPPDDQHGLASVLQQMESRCE